MGGKEGGGVRGDWRRGGSIQRDHWQSGVLMEGRECDRKQKERASLWFTCLCKCAVSKTSSPEAEPPSVLDLTSEETRIKSQSIKMWILKSL